MNINWTNKCETAPIILSPVERIAKTNPDMEIWWDSSPLVYEQWKLKTLEDADPGNRAVLRSQLERLYNAEEPEKSIFRGCTTNPPLSLAAVQSDPQSWNRWIDDLIRSSPDLSQREICWSTYKEVVRRGAEMYLPIFIASKYRFGWISGQLDPHHCNDTDTMISTAEELSSIAPNVMIKVPATKQGIEALKVLTEKAISTNVTVCFTLSQILTSSHTVLEGLQVARENKADLTRWRSVITMMIGRLTEREELDRQAERRNIRLTRMDKHWFGIAIFKRSVRMLHDNGCPSKMLACSLRAGPYVAGKMRFWDIQMIAGGDIVFTMPPYVLDPLFKFGDDLDFRPEAIQEEVPIEIMDRLLRIPYVIHAYDPNGLALEEFNTHPSTVFTIENFSKAFQGLEDYVGKRIALTRQKI